MSTDSHDLLAGLSDAQRKVVENTAVVLRQFLHQAVGAALVAYGEGGEDQLTVYQRSLLAPLLQTQVSPREKVAGRVNERAQSFVEQETVAEACSPKAAIAFAEQLLRDLEDLVGRIKNEDPHGRMSKKDKAAFLLKEFFALAGEAYKVGLKREKRWPAPGIDPQRELDHEKLHYAEDKYEIGFDPIDGLVCGISEIDLWPDRPSAIYRTAAERVTMLGAGTIPGVITLRRYYKLRLGLTQGDGRTDPSTEKWLPPECRHKITPITSDTINSGDLLDQVLVVYLIKQAQNSDKDAVGKLMEVYRARTSAFSREFRLSYKHLDPRVVANDASTILYLALSGDDPVNIVTSCDEEFQWSTSWGNILWPVITDCLPKLTQEFIELARMYESRMERGELSEIRAAGELYLPYLDLLNAWKPPSWLHWEVEGGTGAYRLNPDSYNPAKSKSVSLTTWLFGAADRPMQGALWRRLCRLYKNEVAWAKHTCAYHPGVSYGDENDGDEVDRPIELLPDDHKAPLGEEEEGALRKILGKYQATCEVSVRDIAIVRLKLAQDMSEDPLTYAEIGQELGLSLGERQLKRIWRQFEDWRDCHDSEVRRDLGM